MYIYMNICMNSLTFYERGNEPKGAFRLTRRD